MSDDTLKGIALLGIGAGAVYIISQKTDWLGTKTTQVIKTADVNVSSATPLTKTSNNDKKDASEDNDKESDTSDDKKQLYILDNNPIAAITDLGWGGDGTGTVHDVMSVVESFTPMHTIESIVSNMFKGEFAKAVTEKTDTPFVYL